MGAKKFVSNSWLRLTSTVSRPAWCAIITGTERGYKLRRQFIDQDSTKGQVKNWLLENGVIYNFKADGTSYYIRLENGEVEELTQWQVLEAMEQAEREQGLLSYL